MKIFIQNLQKKIPIDPKKVRGSALKVLQIERIKKTGQINFLFVRDKKIKELNSKYCGKDTATDVLAFDISTPTQDQIFADIVISTDAAIRNARLFRSSSQYEIYLYVIHGILHLLGYDDRNTRQKKIMDDRTTVILGKLNINLNLNLKSTCHH